MHNQVLTYIENNRERFLDELKSFLRIPSVSARPEHANDIRSAAEFVRDKMRLAGATSEIHETAGHPIVFAEKLVDPSLPTVLVYGHYDVQPADPIELWDTPPFEPTIIDDKIYARGACDDKGQMYMHIKAMEMMTVFGDQPCNLKFLFEGEEEVGSTSLSKYITDNQELLAADVVLISDTAIANKSTPTIVTGLKGICYLEMTLTGPNKDLHSGIYGGAVANPANVLCEIVGRLKDVDNKITIPGFYDSIQPPSKAELDDLKKLGFSDDQYAKEIGVSELHGEKGFSTLERLFYRPTLDVNGITTGYQQAGAKTVLPSTASAKISMRLVPGQQATDICQKFTAHVKKQLPPGIEVSFEIMASVNPVLVSSDSKFYQAASNAIQHTFNTRPVSVRIGGTIPVVNYFKTIMGLDTILMGFGFDSDDIHSPNEHFGLWNYFKGIETIPLYYQELQAIAANAEAEVLLN